MILEQICRTGSTIDDRPEQLSWSFSDNSYWTTNNGRRDLNGLEPFNTYRQNAFRLLLRTKNGKIMNPYDLPVIRMIEEDLFTYKRSRTKLFHCEWKNNDINLPS